MRLFWLVIFVGLVVSCDREQSEVGGNSAELTLDEYHDYTGDDAANFSGGARMIPITTPSRDFEVWTKRVGNNPTIKVLLLHGGPGVNHAYFECFDSFLPKEGIEYIYYDQETYFTGLVAWLKDR